MNSYLRLTDQMNNDLLKLHQYKLELWNNYVLFDWHWWLGVALTIIPIATWLLFYDRKSVKSLLIAGLTSAILSAILDTSGHFLGWYDYRYDVFPVAPYYIPWDFVLIPVLTMFTIQLFKNINIYLKGLILSVLVAFLALPFLSSVSIYVLIEWNYIYSFIITFIIFVLSFHASKITDTK